jgi:hypothetical protein
MLRNTSGMTLVTFLAITAVVISLLAASFLPYEAEAIPVRHGVSGTGTGTVICPDGIQIINNAQINVFFDKFSGRTGGIVEVSSGFVIGSGDLSASILGQGQVANNKFSVSGLGAPGFEGDTNLCNSSVTPTNIFASGTCSNGAVIQFQAADGTKGSFTGNVFCNRFTSP